MKRYIPLLILTFFPLIGFGQWQFQYDDTPPVIQNGKTLDMAWAGGLNGVQLNTLDIDGDGDQDLIIYDKSSNRILPFLLQNGTYELDRAYAHYFPEEVADYLFLRDYDKDGKPDLFTAAPLGIQVFQNTSKGLPSWNKVTDYITTIGLSGQTINIQVNRNDLPALEDVDGDGDLDIMAFNYAGLDSRLRFYKNFSVEDTGTPGLDNFKLVNDHWGNFTECNCGDFRYDDLPCNSGRNIAASTAARHTGGKSVLLYDWNGDGLIDVVTSHEYCQEAYAFQNTKSNLDSAQMMPGNFQFPDSLQPAQFPVYPAAYRLDVDGDQQKDLIFSPDVALNASGAIDFSHSIWLYKGQSNHQYKFQTDAFLQSQMIDMGEYAAPTFFDVDGDGDQDLIMGYTVNENGQYVSGLALWENTGNPQQPSFSLVDQDYLGLKSQGLLFIKPQWYDTNGDGKMDLNIVAQNSSTITLYALANQANQGYTWDQNFQSIPVNLPFGSTVCLADVNEDGKVDILVGKSSGGLLLYENQASQPGDFNFPDKTEGYLGITDNYLESQLTITTGDINGDGKEDLITSNRSGSLKIYSDFKHTAQLQEVENVYNALGQDFVKARLGVSAGIAVAPIFSGRYPSIIMGSIDGGLMLLRNTKEKPVLEKPDYSLLQIYPVPTNTSISFTAKEDGTLSIFDLGGKIIYENLPLQKDQLVSLKVKNWTSGLYIAKFRSNTGKTESKKFIIGP